MSARIFSSAGLQACVLVATIALTLHAQTFDVASIKRNVEVSNSSGNTNLPGGRVSFTNRPLRSIIRSAFGSIDMEVIGGPGWIDTERWNIVASAGRPVEDEVQREMLKALLMDRFKLVAHVEKRERPIYELVFARADRQLGAKLRPTECNGPGCGNTSGNTNGIISGTLTGRARTIEDLGRALSNYAERRVFDRTGLEGKYDFEVTWSQEVPIFTALPDQLGLKLQPQRAPLDVVVVDSVERPVED